MTDIEKALNEIQKSVGKATQTQAQRWRQELALQPTASSENAKVTPPTIADAVETVVNNRSDNKYIFSIILTACIKKIVSPGQDIRIAQDNMKNGYSNRSLDQRHITPFLKRFNYTHCEASGLESGRNLERPLPWNLKYPCNPRGAGNREAFLGLLHFIQEKNGNPKTVAKYLLFYDKSKHILAAPLKKAPIEHSIEKIMQIFTTHFHESSGQGKSRLPVLALYSIYSCLVEEMSRFKGTKLLPLERHTTADLRSKSIGDIVVFKNNMPFEGVEVKSEKPITAAMVNELTRKIHGHPVNRYYILTTYSECILSQDIKSVEDAVKKVESETGCQIITNGLIRTLWYYLRLLSDPSAVLPIYAGLLKTDEDIRAEIRESWNKIISKHA